MIPLYSLFFQGDVLIQCIPSEDLCCDCYYFFNKVYSNEAGCPEDCFPTSRPGVGSVIYKEIDCICL